MITSFENYIISGAFDPSSKKGERAYQTYDYYEDTCADYLREGNFEGYYQNIMSGRGQALKLNRKMLPLFTGKRVKNLCVTTQGGYGDIFLFARYFPALLEKANNVSIIVGSGLIDLFKKHMPSNVRVCGRNNGVDALYKANAFVIYDALPYIAGKGYGDAAWIKSTQPKKPNNKPRVGVVWAGSDTAPHNAVRSIPIARFKRLFDIQGIEWHSLQVGDYAHECPEGVIDHSKEIKSWSDTVDIVNTLDLVISVDTGTANLVGSMGFPLWVLLHITGEFRWGNEGEATPWFPSARVFRQPRIYDWDAVLNNLTSALLEWKSNWQDSV